MRSRQKASVRRAIVHRQDRCHMAPGASYSTDAAFVAATPIKRWVGRFNAVYGIKGRKSGCYFAFGVLDFDCI